MSVYDTCLEKLRNSPKTWLVTGVAGFIGSNILETLLKNNQKVKGLDNFSTGHQKNLDIVRNIVGEDIWKNFSFIKGDIRDRSACESAVSGVDHVLHEAAIGSVVRSMEDPIFTNENNISGFLNMLVATKDQGATFVYAASSSTYGDEPTLPKVEEKIGKPLSPYAVTKYVNELYASVFARAYNFRCIGLRYFNVFGKRQDPDGAYAAVIPQWFADIIKGRNVFINGDGETSRDFCYIDNCVQANILASCTKEPEAWDRVYNVAVGQQTTLNELFSLIQSEVKSHFPDLVEKSPVYRDFRAGDVRHSLANISLAKKMLGYTPRYTLTSGLKDAAAWYAKSIQ